MDRDKVINYLESEIKRAEQSVNDTWLECVEVKLFRDVLALLKEQEAKQVNISQMHYGIKYGLCPRCEKQIDTLVNPHYCGNCGQELKWE